MVPVERIIDSRFWKRKWACLFSRHPKNSEWESQMRLSLRLTQLWFWSPYIDFRNLKSLAVSAKVWQRMMAKVNCKLWTTTKSIFYTWNLFIRKGTSAYTSDPRRWELRKSRSCCVHSLINTHIYVSAVREWHWVLALHLGCTSCFMGCNYYLPVWLMVRIKIWQMTDSTRAPNELHTVKWARLTYGC